MRPDLRRRRLLLLLAASTLSAAPLARRARAEAARAAGDATPFTVGIVGDMGTINGGPSTAGMIGRAAETEFTLHIGDISYADDTLEEFYEATWNDFMNRIQPLAANQAYMVLPGNHEGVLITLVLHAFSDCPTTWCAS
jgi:hypothetical protein